jgi:4-hydroxy-tetrahydrodipicolinate synthase
MSTARLPHGIYPYLVSPIDAAGNVDAPVLSRLVDDLVKAGVDGLTPLGSTGEIIYLTPEQRRRIVEVTLEAAAGRVPVVPGVAAFSIDDGVRQARLWEALGAAGIVVMRQNGFATTEEGALGYFERVAGAVSNPSGALYQPGAARHRLLHGRAAAGSPSCLMSDTSRMRPATPGGF